MKITRTSVKQTKVDFKHMQSGGVYESSFNGALVICGPTGWFDLRNNVFITRVNNFCEGNQGVVWIRLEAELVIS